MYVSFYAPILMFYVMFFFKNKQWKMLESYKALNCVILYHMEKFVSDL